MQGGQVLPDPHMHQSHYLFIRNMAKNDPTDLTVEKKLETLFQLQTTLSQIDEKRALRGELPLEVQDLEDEIAGLLGYWRCGYSYYMEIGEDELIIRDSLKRPIMETGYDVVKDQEKLYLQPEEDFFTYPDRKSVV